MPRNDPPKVTQTCSCKCGRCSNGVHCGAHSSGCNK